jgi:hypothetical protein
MAEQQAKTVSPQAAYATPDRDNKTDPTPPTKLTLTELPVGSERPTTVTPLDAVPGGKHVRFGKEEKEKEEGSTETQRGLVSRRGGRLGGSPAQPRPAADGPVLEFKTYRSPQRKGDATENDTIPSLCSTNSGISSVEPAEKGSGQKVAKDAPGADQKVAAASEEETEKSRRPSSISCDALIDTSPLTSNVVDASPSGTVTRSKGKAQKSDQAEKEGRRIVTFSPPTPQSEMARMDTVRLISLCPCVYCLSFSI